MKSALSKAVGMYSVVLVAIMMMSFTISISLTSNIHEASSDPFYINSEAQPAPFNAPIPIDPRGVTEDGDFIVSFDDNGSFDAQFPSIMVTPTNPDTISNGYAGSIHTIWQEFNNDPIHGGFSEIHYSMSWPDERGQEWSNDEVFENDTIISDSDEGTTTGQTNAISPSIAIDPMGTLHVVWVQGYDDGTFEIHHSMSDDNGRTWSGFDNKAESLVSNRDQAENSFWIDTAKIAISSNPIVIHAVWSEWGGGDGICRTRYSRSFDLGMTWTGDIDGDVIISDPVATENANLADIAVGGADGRIVHVAWTQDMPQGAVSWSSEALYTRSMDTGDSWEPISIISRDVDDGNFAGRVQLAASEDRVHAIWDQYNGVLFTPGEVYYSGSSQNGDPASWTGLANDMQISHSDGNDVWNPTIATDPGTGGIRVHVVWTELDALSTMGTEEVHESVCDDAFAASPVWSGANQDVVISFPDEEDAAHAYNPDIDIGFVANEWRPQIVWSESNTIDLTGNSNSGDDGLNMIAQSNNEINYIPETTYDIPITSTGWNFISIPLVQNDETITTVLDDSWGDGATTWSEAYWYDATDSTDHWKHYNTATSTLADLTTIDHEIGFWIKITSLGDGDLTFAGDYPVSTTINLKAGWNLIGYPAQNDTAYDIASMKGDVTGILLVEGYDSGGTYLLQSLADPYVLKRGEAYWVKVSGDVSWTIDW